MKMLKQHELDKVARTVLQENDRGGASRDHGQYQLWLGPAIPLNMDIFENEI